MKNFLKIDLSLEEVAKIFKSGIDIRSHFINFLSEDLVSSLKELGTLGGSRGIGLESHDSDWDFFFTDETAFNAAKKLVEHNREIVSVDTEEWQPYHNTQRLVRVSRAKPGPLPKINGNSIDLVLVDRILSKDEQIFAHLEKHPEKLSQISSLPEGWEEWIFEKKYARKLSKGLATKYVLWLSDQGKI